MDKNRLILLIVLVAIFAASLFFMFQSKNREFGLITLISAIGLAMLLMSGEAHYIYDPIMNYKLWFETDSGQISNWPDPRSVGDSINYHWKTSDRPDMPLGGYWRFTWKNPSGKREYLDLKCAPVGWNPLRDLHLNNVLKLATPKIEPRSTSQEFNRDKSLGYHSNRNVKELRKELKDSLGFDPIDAYKRKRSAS